MTLIALITRSAASSYHAVSALPAPLGRARCDVSRGPGVGAAAATPRLRWRGSWIGGPHRRTAAELFEFDDHLKYVKPWSPDNYAAPFTLLRIDKYDNIWRVEEASGLIVKFDPDTVKMVRGRKRGERLTRGAVSGAMK